jgi:lysophospholipase L1-like esterase
MAVLRPAFILLFMLIIAADAQVKVVLVGDSTVANIGALDPLSGIHGWGEDLQYFFKPNTVLIDNFAYPGETTKTFLTNGNIERVIMAHPQYVLIDLGIIDSNPSGGEYVPLSKYTANLRFIVRQLRENGAHVTLVEPHTLRKVSGGFFGADGMVRSYRQAMLTVGRLEHVDVLQFGTITKNYFDDIGVQKTYGLFIDAIHFNSKGAMIGAYFISRLLVQAHDSLGYFVQ